MTKRRMVWAVSSGEYSDYRVEAMFETEDDARTAMESGLGDDMHEMPLFPPGTVLRRVQVHYANGNAQRAGKLADVAIRTHSQMVWDLGDNPAPRRPRVEERRSPDGRMVWVHVECASAKLAEKALRDRLAHIYAEFAGVAS